MQALQPGLDLPAVAATCSSCTVAIVTGAPSAPPWCAFPPRCLLLPQVLQQCIAAEGIHLSKHTCGTVQHTTSRAAGADVPLPQIPSLDIMQKETWGMVGHWLYVLMASLRLGLYTSSNTFTCRATCAWCHSLTSKATQCPAHQVQHVRQVLAAKHLPLQN